MSPSFHSLQKKNHCHLRINRESLRRRRHLRLTQFLMAKAEIRIFRPGTRQTLALLPVWRYKDKAVVISHRATAGMLRRYDGGSIPITTGCPSMRRFVTRPRYIARFLLRWRGMALFATRGLRSGAAMAPGITQDCERFSAQIRCRRCLTIIRATALM